MNCWCGDGPWHEDWHDLPRYFQLEEPELGDVLRDYLRGQVAESGTPSAWVMDYEWAKLVRRLLDEVGRPIWEPSCVIGGPDFLLGVPMCEPTGDGGVPHLEPA